MTAKFDKVGARLICDEATEGPWQWFGNTKMHEVYLSTVHRGRILVMDFARWGMSYAQPRFQVRLDGPNSGIMRTLGELGKEEHPLGPCFEVSYRRHFTGIGHPDAKFIAQSRALLPQALDRIDELEAALQDALALTHVAEHAQDDEWRAERDRLRKVADNG